MRINARNNRRKKILYLETNILKVNWSKVLREYGRYVFFSYIFVIITNQREEHFERTLYSIFLSDKHEIELEIFLKFSRYSLILN